MQRLDVLRKRFDTRSQWIQVGLASATLLTPLLKRWNDLRAAEQARALRTEAEARLRGMRSRLPLPRDAAQHKAQEVIEQTPARKANVSATIWLVGVGIGLVAAGTGAYFLVRRRLRQRHEEPMVDLPVPPNGNMAHLRETARTLARQISQRDKPAASAPAIGGAAPTSTATQAGPLMPPAMQAEHAADDTMLTEDSAPTSALDVSTAAFIGNIHTLVYHSAGAKNLPAEENRIYFASEEEAHQRGYHRDRDEVSSGGGE